MDVLYWSSNDKLSMGTDWGVICWLLKPWDGLRFSKESVRANVKAPGELHHFRGRTKGEDLFKKE